MAPGPSPSLTPMSATAVDPLTSFRVDGKVAIVTGASAGLGERFARVLHAAGASVVVAARRRERLEALVADLPGTHAVPADLAVAEDRERLVANAVSHFGRLDVLVNNAGITTTGGIESETLDTFRGAMEINVTALWHLCKLAGPHLVAAGGGSVINLASMLGLVGSTPVKQANYCASKGAVINLTRELALQWARKNVRVNALCPGWFPSEMTHGMDTDEGSIRYVQANSPMPRMGRPEELDGPLLLLASDAGSFITGQTLVVDGGWTAR
jgi:NAD(P)-dependent dehydrogenase (short-subunit alcohol dehydrogenase family)